MKHKGSGIRPTLASNTMRHDNTHLKVSMERKFTQYRRS